MPITTSEILLFKQIRTLIVCFTRNILIPFYFYTIFCYLITGTTINNLREVSTQQGEVKLWMTIIPIGTDTRYKVRRNVRFQKKGVLNSTLFFVGLFRDNLTKKAFVNQSVYDIQLVPSLKDTAIMLWVRNCNKVKILEGLICNNKPIEHLPKHIAKSLRVQ